MIEKKLKMKKIINEHTLLIKDQREVITPKSSLFYSLRS
jgi:hypothetical protein